MSHDRRDGSGGSGPPIPRILVIEDHLLLSGTLIAALREEGFDAVAMSGPTVDDLLARARAMAPVLVLLDLDLGPLGAGDDLVGPLRDAGATVVVLTGIENRARMATCVAAGAVGIIPKTVDFASLMRSVELAAAGEPLLSAGERYAMLAEVRARGQERRQRRAAFETLSRREQDVLRELIRGRSVDAIAADNFVALSTVRTQVRAILRKLGVNSQLEAVARARSARWPDEEEEQAGEAGGWDGDDVG